MSYKAGLGLGVKIGQSLAMTPQLQQAIRLLQLSSLELKQEIQQKLETNPMLELELSEDYMDQQDAELPDADSEYEPDPELIPDELSIDTDWDSIYEPSGSGAAPPEPKEDFYGGTHEGIAEHLARQMLSFGLSPMHMQVCAELIDNLDERGYLSVPELELYESMKQRMTQHSPEFCLEDVQVVLDSLKMCEPAGIGASNLQECLELQVMAQERLGAETKRQTLSLLAHIDELLKHDLKKLAKASGLNQEQIVSAMNVLRSLNPEPASSFRTPDTESHTPDVVVKKHGSGFRVFLNPEVVPKLKIYEPYAAMVERGSTADDQNFLKEQLSDARQFIRGVQERNRSLLRVAEAIVAAQYDFFESGPLKMKPMILKDVADAVELHESTISRITTSKTMLTPQGMFELKYFFSSHVSAEGGEQASSVAVSAQIKALIDSEDPKKPLSDSKLVKLLADQGVEVARRTVAKYREAMNIGSSVERKRLV